MERSYGRPVGVEPARVITTHDGMTLTLGTRMLEFIDTPGHARHHHCVWDARTRTWFTGDTFGLGYPEMVNRQRPLGHADRRAGAVRPRAVEGIGGTAAGARTERAVRHPLRPRAPTPPHLGPLLLSQIDEMAAIGNRLRDAPERHARLREAFVSMYRHRLARTRLHRRRSAPAADGDGRRAQCAGAGLLARPQVLILGTWVKLPSHCTTASAVITGAAQGIGEACAGAWRATAPRWRCGTSTSPRRRRSPPSSKAQGASALASAATCRARPRSMPRSPPRSGARAGQRAGQQRRHLQGRRLPRHHRGRLGRGDRRQPEGSFLVGAGGGAADGARWRRRHRQHELGQRRAWRSRASPATTPARAASTSSRA